MSPRRVTVLVVLACLAFLMCLLGVSAKPASAASVDDQINAVINALADEQLNRRIATALTIPYAAIPGNTISSSGYNSNNSTIASLLNGNLDSSNINPTRGIGANFITSTGTGVTGIFQPGGYTMIGQGTNQTPLTVQQAQGVGSAQAGGANIFQVCTYITEVTPPVQNCPVYIDSTGALNVQNINFNGGLSPTNLNVPGTATINTLQVTGTAQLSAVQILGNLSIIGNTSLAGASSSGPISSSTAPNTINSYVPPIFTPSGNPVSSTMHGVQYSCAFSAATSCNISLSGVAAFTSGTTYSCAAPDLGSGGAAPGYLPYVGSKTATSFVVYTFPTTVTSATIYGLCFGT